MAGYIISIVLSLGSVIASYIGIVQQDALLQFGGIAILSADVGLLVFYLSRMQQAAQAPEATEMVVEKLESATPEAAAPVRALADRVAEILRRGANAQVYVETMVSDRCILQIQTAIGERHIGIVLYTENSVGLADIRGLYSLILNTQSQHGVFFTNGTFSAQAVQWAEGKPLHLINGYGLQQLAAKYDLA